MNNLKRISRIIVILLSILAVCLSLTACNKKEEGISAGFDFGEGEESHTDYTAYSSDKSKFDINDVTLTFYFGGVFSPSIEHELENGRNIPFVKLYFRNYSSQQNIFIRQTEDYISEQYRMFANNDSIFSHSEVLTIPKELFVGEKGVIYFYTWGDDIREWDVGEKIIASIPIFYKVNDNVVTLSAKSFDK